MPKAILVMDMPESCHKCPLFGVHYSDMCCCGLNNRSINYPYPENFRQAWCPLKKLPDKEELIYEYDEYEDGYVFGWNHCLEKILSE